MPQDGSVADQLVLRADHIYDFCGGGVIRLIVLAGGRAQRLGRVLEKPFYILPLKDFLGFEFKQKGFTDVESGKRHRLRSSTQYLGFQAQSRFHHISVPQPGRGTDAVSMLP
jgi:hypothetical protein